MNLSPPNITAEQVATNKYESATSTRLLKAHCVPTDKGVPKSLSAPTPASSLTPSPPGVKATTDAKTTTGIAAAICQSGMCKPTASAVWIDISTTTQKRPKES